MSMDWTRRLILPALMAAVLLHAAVAAGAQEPGTPPPPAPSLASYAVAPRTRFLVKLNDELTTRKLQENKKFKAHTLEPLEAGNGTILRPGAEIRGHVSRIEPAAVTGRARLWLTFDEIKTPYGDLPIVAEVVSVPGEHSVKPGPSKEGEIEARTSKGREELEAAAAGAAIGAASGGVKKGGKGAAIGAATGAAAGFLISSGMGHELDLPKGSKLELELERPLYLMKE
jgi:YMGG-like Gly-zipper